MGSLGERSLMTTNSTDGWEREGKLIVKKLRFSLIRVQTPLSSG